MKCFNCGAEVGQPARFCGECGTLVSDPHEATLAISPAGEDDLLQRVRMVLAGEYEVDRELGRGGMAVVFKATEVGLRRPVALKILPPDLGLTVRAVERFKREARTVAELDHPNIVPVHRVGQIGGVLHIAMKLVEGRSLDAIITAQRALPVPVVLYVLRGATRALAYAHDRGIVHRDVKGANILIDSDGRVLVSDFGVALRSSDVTITVDGSVIGTPPFMSPEQCSGQRAGPQSDQYSLGIVAFQMLSGAVPFQADTLAGIMQHHFFTPVPDLRQVRDDVPDALLDVLHGALEKNPARRFPTTRAMLAAIEAIPFPEADRLTSERTLQALSRGESIPRVSARAVPPLPDAPTMPLRLPVRRSMWTKAWPRSRLPRAGIAAATVLLLSAVWWIARPGPAVPPAANATSPPPTGRSADSAAPGPRALGAPAATTAGAGKLRLLTSPPSAQISIDGRPVGVGSVFDLAVAAGPRRLLIRAPGYATFDSIVVVPVDATLSLGRITLRDRDRGP